jgi:hypothetical protein
MARPRSQSSDPKHWIFTAEAFTQLLFCPGMSARVFQEQLLLPPLSKTHITIFGNTETLLPELQRDPPIQTAESTTEVMGSDYQVAYSVQGASSDAKRKGKNFSTADFTKIDFYRNL